MKQLNDELNREDVVLESRDSRLLQILKRMGYLSYQGVGFGLKIIAGLMGSAVGFTVASCLGKRIALPLLASSYITPTPVSTGFLFFVYNGAFHGWYLGVLGAKTVYKGVGYIGEKIKLLYFCRNSTPDSGDLFKDRNRAEDLNDKKGANTLEQVINSPAAEDRLKQDIIDIDNEGMASFFQQQDNYPKGECCFVQSNNFQPLRSSPNFGSDSVLLLYRQSLEPEVKGSESLEPLHDNNSCDGCRIY